jgi:hypothetical protein
MLRLLVKNFVLVILGGIRKAYLMSFFRHALLESFRKLLFGLEFPEFLNPKKNPEDLQGELGDS